MATEIARQIGKFAAENLPKGTKISVAEIRYNGLLSGSDFMITTDKNPVRHPLYDFMAENGYLSELRSGNPLNISTNNQHSQQQSVINDYGYQKGDGTVAFTGYNPTLRDNPEHPLVVSVANTRNPAGTTIRSQDTLSFMEKPVCSSTGIKLTGKINRASRLDRIGMSATIGVIPNSTAWEASIKYPTTGYGESGGLYSYSSLDTLQPDLLSRFKATGVLSQPVVRSLGIHVQSSAVLGQSTAFVPLPFVAGTRRYVALIPGRGSTSVCTISGYILGEGRDVIYQSFDFIEVTPDGVMRIGTALNTIYADPLPPLLSSEIKQHSFVTRQTYYPMSYNTVFLDDIISNGKAVSTMDGSDDVINSCTISYTLVDVEVSKIKGSISKVELRKYLSTGYGIFPPKTEAEVSTIMKSWEKVPDSIAFVIAPYNCSGYSFKKTKLYSEYRRKREKACKENDFLERKFNDEYTYRQVENRLSSLTTKSVIALDRSLVGKGSGVSVMSPATNPSITFSVKDATSLNYVTSEGNTGTVFKEADKIADLLASLDPPHVITGAVSELESVMGMGVASFNDEVNGRVDTSISMRVEDQMLADIFDYDTLKTTQSYDQMVAIMALQVTDYVNFEEAAPRLVRALMGDKVYPALLKKLALTSTP